MHCRQGTPSPQKPATGQSFTIFDHAVMARAKLPLPDRAASSRARQPYRRRLPQHRAPYQPAPAASAAGHKDWPHKPDGGHDEPPRQAPRIRPALASAAKPRQHTISMMVAALARLTHHMRHAPLNSTSAEALERLPILSFRRWIFRPLAMPFSRRRGWGSGTGRHGPAPASESIDIGADANHLWPERREVAAQTRPASYWRAYPAALLFSDAKAERQAGLCAIGFCDWSYLRCVTRGARSRNSCGLDIGGKRSAGHRNRR